MDNGTVKSYKDLIVWQKSMDMVKELCFLTKALPKEELYVLSMQMRRAAVSVPSNIAEGQQRKSSKEFSNFLSIARGSNAELQTQVLLCINLNYFSEQQADKVLLLSEEVSKMLNALIDKITDH